MATRPAGRMAAACSAVVVALSLAACSADAGTGDGGSDSALRVVYGTAVHEFDPCGTQDGRNTPFLRAVFAPLVYSDPRTGELSPGLASAWEFSEDKLTFTLTLRPGLTFQDGSPLDAAAAVESLSQCLEMGNQAIDGLTGISAEGSDRVVVTLDRPSAGLPTLLSNRLGMLASPSARTSMGPAFASQPVGAGPFRVAEFVPGSRVLLERWDGYTEAGPPPAAARALDVSLVTDPSAQVAMLTGGQADFGFRLDPTTVSSLEGQPSLTTEVVSGTSAAYLNVDRSQGPLADLRLRQAISYAIDRKALAEAATDGLSDTPTVQPYPPGHMAHTAELADRYPYDPERARQLLREAGHPDGLTLKGVSLPDPIYQDTAVIVAAQLAEVGIDVQFEARDIADGSKAFYSDHSFNLFAAAQPLNDWPVTFRRLLTTSSSANSGHVPIPGGDEAWAALNEAFTDEERRAGIARANEVLVEQLSIIPLYFTSVIFAWDESVVGAEQSLSPDGYAQLPRLATNGSA